MVEQVSHLLVRWSQGDAAAMEQLMPIVYDELRKLGRSHLGRRPQEALLQPTVLVHEAWMKLAADKDDLSLTSRAQFYALAAKVMRDVLVDHYRRQTAQKRGGSRIAVSLDDVPGTPPSMDLLALNDALERLAEIKARYAQIVELKFFAGMTIEETAAALQTSRATIEREWNFARSWLRRELGS